MKWDNWPRLWESGLSACVAHGGTKQNRDIRDLKIAPPATESRVLEVEHALGQRIPESLRQVFLQFSASVEYFWSLPEEALTDVPFGMVFSGKCAWDLDMMVSMEEDRKGWVAACFPNINDPYHAVWHNKLAFMTVDTGDLLALDLLQNSDPVTYLSHDGDEDNGSRLADDFQDFINRWSLLGCPGPECWQMAPFTSSPQSGLEPAGENARIWRQWFGLRV